LNKEHFSSSRLYGSFRSDFGQILSFFTFSLHSKDFFHQSSF